MELNCHVRDIVVGECIVEAIAEWNQGLVVAPGNERYVSIHVPDWTSSASVVVERIQGSCRGVE